MATNECGHMVDVLHQRSRQGMNETELQTITRDQITRLATEDYCHNIL
jgi:hypothetical protein